MDDLADIFTDASLLLGKLDSQNNFLKELFENKPKDRDEIYKKWKEEYDTQEEKLKNTIDLCFVFRAKSITDLAIVDRNDPDYVSLPEEVSDEDRNIIEGLLGQAYIRAPLTLTEDFYWEGYSLNDEPFYLGSLFCYETDDKVFGPDRIDNIQNFDTSACESTKTNPPTSSPTWVSVTKNIALGKLAIQSSTHTSHVAERAVDGVTSSLGSHTAVVTDNPYWEVDLGGEYVIEQVRIWHRTANTDRIRGLQVVVYREGFIVWKWNAPSSNWLPSGADTLLPVVPSVVGTGVRLAIPGDNKILELNEVQVMGYELPILPPSSNIALNKITYQTTTYNPESTEYASDKAVDGNKETLTSTFSQTDPYWYVHLGQKFTILKVVIWNREDCCFDDLIGFQLEILQGSEVVWKRDVDQRDYALVVADIDIRPFNKVIGNIVRVSLKGKNRVLSLGEVQVYGY